MVPCLSEQILAPPGIYLSRGSTRDQYQGTQACPNPHLENERTVRKLVKILSIEDASLEEDMAELRKKMDTMPANFINEDERAGLDSTVCCESHAELEVNINKDHQAENLNMFNKTKSLCNVLNKT